jgi:hypothetical protein
MLDFDVCRLRGGKASFVTQPSTRSGCKPEVSSISMLDAVVQCINLNQCNMWLLTILGEYRSRLNGVILLKW